MDKNINEIQELIEDCYSMVLAVKKDQNISVDLYGNEDDHLELLGFLVLGIMSKYGIDINDITKFIEDFAEVVLNDENVVKVEIDPKLIDEIKNLSEGDKDDEK